MIGVSGPSISITTLSIRRPESAARRCSTVQTLAPEASPSVVLSEVCVTLPRLASSRRSRPPGNPVRRNVTPVSAWAG